ncbi:DoxX-like family protein [Klenkia soli]|uniref:DoxX-like family protein n=1 Tax=Klenkia soli TaxID=1052260 RepID=A0A1H0E7R1_9ACTN|nr:DoxX family protein [Klenkia soli]SDN78452.1 DoxX-like family protein [Klenkia soli]
MFIATVVVTVFLTVALVASAIGKLTKNEGATAAVLGVGVPANRIPVLAALELAGAVGLVIGLVLWAPLGIAAAVGVVLYFLGAVVAHLRVKDNGYGPAAFLLLVAVAALVLRSITA